MSNSDHLGAVAEVLDDDDSICEECSGLNGNHFWNCAYWDPQQTFRKAMRELAFRVDEDYDNWRRVSKTSPAKK